MEITRIDLADQRHCDDFIAMLDHYARSPEGGGKALEPERLAQLPTVLADCPTWVGFLAHEGDQVAGVVDGFWSVSTFAARRLLNIHDLAVHADFRRRGVGRRLLKAMDDYARELDCCKLTLEVLAGNRGAMTLYENVGFAFYRLDPAMGEARFMQKWLEKK